MTFNQVDYKVIFYRETDFKDTEIGRIPREWDVEKLGDIANVVAGYSFPLEFQGKSSGRYPFIKVGDMNKSRKYLSSADNYVDEEDLKALKAKPFPKGTIIFPKIGMAMKLNKFRILDVEALFDNNIAGIIVNKAIVDSEFLYYYLLGKVNLMSLAGATTVPSITKTRLKQILISIPPFEEQSGIAKVLSTIDRAIEVETARIEKLERLKRGLMELLLTGKVRVREENGKLTFYRETQLQETSIGKIPKEWKVIKLGEIVEVFDNKRIPLSERERANKKGPFPYCGANGIIDYIDDYIFDGEYVLLAEDGGYYGPFEKSAYLMNGKFWANNHVHVLKAKEGIADNRFLVYMLNFLDLRPYLVGSTRAKLNQKDMGRIILPLPLLEEQLMIAEVLSTIDHYIEVNERQVKKLERLKRGLMELLLTGKVRVMVDDSGT